MKKRMYKILHGVFRVLDVITGGMGLPWEYSDSKKRRMKERIDGKK